MRTVSVRALLGRVKRKLAHEGSRICIAHERHFNDLGRYYVVDSYNHITGPHMTNDGHLLLFAKELGCVGAGEVLGGSGEP